MEAFKVIWKYRLLIVVIVGGGYLWYQSEEAEKQRIVMEKQIAAEAAAKKEREQKLFDQYNALKRRNPSKCNIRYVVKLETYGANVNVELRVGVLGNSFPLVIKQAQDSELAYTGLCPGNYFVAIGDGKNVSTTPVRDFTTGKRYTSTVRMTKGVGNMVSSNRERL